MIDPEIIIVGSGPAGCSTALHLVAQSADWRHRILVLEAKRHPRRKLCGGGLTVFGLQALKGLGLELCVPHVEVREARFRYRARMLAVHGEPLLQVVERSAFDEWLVKEVRARDVQVIEESPVQAILPSRREVTVRTAAFEYHPQAVVLACGSRALGILGRGGMGRHAGPGRVALALETYDAGSSARAEDGMSFVDFDFSTLAHGGRGYRWKFPMPGPLAGAANFGVFDTRGSARGGARSLRADLEAYLDEWGAGDLDAPQGHPVRLYSPFVRLSEPRVLLAGDAAGADPFFGEGIGVGLAYGRAAALEIDRARGRADYSFNGYATRVRASELGDYLGLRWMTARAVYEFAPLPGFKLLSWAVARLISSGYHPRL